MLLPYPTPFSMPFLKFSGYFLLENVYFCRDRVNILRVMPTLIPMGARFPDLGDVTQKGASSKCMTLCKIPATHKFCILVISKMHSKLRCDTRKISPWTITLSNFSYDQNSTILICTKSLLDIWYLSFQKNPYICMHNLNKGR